MFTITLMSREAGAQETKPLLTLSGPKGVWDLAVSEDKKSLAVADKSGKAFLCEMTEGRCRAILTNEAVPEYEPFKVSIDSSKNQVIVGLRNTGGRDDSRILILSSVTDKIENTFEISGLVRALHQSKFAVSIPAGKPNHLIVIDLATKKQLSTDLPVKLIRHVVVSPDGKQIAIVASDVLVCYELNDGLNKLWEVAIPEAGKHLFFSPNSSTLAHSRLTDVVLYKARTGESLTTLPHCVGLTFTPSGKEIVVLGSAGFGLYPVVQKKAAKPLINTLVTYDKKFWYPLYGPFLSHVVTIDGVEPKLIAAGSNGEVRIWRLTEGGKSVI